MALFDTHISDSENRSLFICYLAFSLCAAATYFIAFVSPYWVVADSGAYALFNRIGLWTACFDGYMRSNNYNKAYFGCFYIFDVEYDSIREWINPLWLYVVQVAASCGMLCEAIIVFFILCQVTGRIVIEDFGLLKFLMTGHFIAGVSLLLTLLGFTYGSYDSLWVPYPRFNKLSWGFATAILSLVLTVISFFMMVVFYLKVHAKTMKVRLVEQKLLGEDDDEVPNDDDRNVQDEIRKLASVATSRNYTEPTGYLQQSVANYQNRLGSEVVENLGDSDENEIYRYS